MCSNIPASSSGGYINGRNSANLELLIDKTSSIYRKINRGSLTVHADKDDSTKHIRTIDDIKIGDRVRLTVLNSVLKFMISGTTSILKS
jgi:hypothetical protein